MRRIAFFLTAALTASFVPIGLSASLASPIPGAPSCATAPTDSHWHADISRLPLDPKSAAYVVSAGAANSLHADFGAGLYDGGPIGIPFATVSGTQAKVPITFDYADESDAGPYPIPPNAPIEGGSSSAGDRHVLVVDRESCRLYEVYAAYPQSGGASWTAGSGAIWNLTSNALRTTGYTSADAAGLPILPGLVRYDEIAAGVIDHAIRITLNNTDNRYVWPATHKAGVNDPNRAPMGERFRLKSSVDIASYPPQSRIVLAALAKYGAIVADNGSSWYISGAPDDRFDNEDLHSLQGLRGSDFEAVDARSLMADPTSGRVAGSTTTTTTISTTTTTTTTTTTVPSARAHRQRRPRARSGVG